MKFVLLVMLFSLLLIGCRKIDIASDTTLSQLEACTGDLFFCVFPIEAEFPGGTEKWHQFLQQNLSYPSSAIDSDIQGTIVVQFLVNANGTLSEIEAISGPEELRESAVEVFKKSPPWIPAQDQGRSITCYKKQPVIFRLVDE